MPRGRIPKPWYRKSTKSYFVNLGGRQIPLGKSKREAHALFHQLMVDRGQGPPIDSKITVDELKDAWLMDREKALKKNTMDSYRGRINAFAAVHGGMRARNMRPYHVAEWANAQEWSQSSRNMGITIVKLCFRWAKRRGYLATNPIADLEKPPITRRRPITMAEAIMIMGAASPHLRTILQILLLTGMRPGEACSLDGRRIDFGARKAIVEGKKTRSNLTGIRTIYLSDKTIDVLRPLVAANPGGPILIGQRGPTTVHAMDGAIARTREKACEKFGLPTGSLDHVTPHCFRGLFSTEALRQGVDSAMLSKVLGQSDPSMLMKHYADPDDPMLLDAMTRATRAFELTPDKPRGPPD